jgi:hypothetical protein
MTEIPFHRSFKVFGLSKERGLSQSVSTRRSRFAIAVVDDSGTMWESPSFNIPSVGCSTTAATLLKCEECAPRMGLPKAAAPCCTALAEERGKRWVGTKMITYTLVGEPGTSLKAAGWKRVAKSRGHPVGQSWDTHPRKTVVHNTVTPVDKWRWEVSVS